MRARVRIAVSQILRAAIAVAGLTAFVVSSPIAQAKMPGMAASLPDAPRPNASGESDLVVGLSSASTSFGAETLPIADTQPSADAQSAVDAAASSVPEQGHGMMPQERDQACQSGALRGKPCRISWLPVLWETLESTSIENTGNIVFDSDTRDALTHNPYWATYAKCVHQFRYRQWRDDDGFIVDYVGHGMQGAIISSVVEQNDPKGRGLVYVNNGNYWRSRLKAMAWVSVFEIQWKIGPAGEASVGNSGLNTYFTPRVKGRSTNETGFQDLVDTPIVGFWWNVAEDALDRFVMPHIWARTHNKLILTALFPLTPCKAAANILRYKPFYYRDFPLTPLR